MSNELNLDQLEALAKAASEASLGVTDRIEDFIRAATPDTVLELIAMARRAAPAAAMGAEGEEGLPPLPRPAKHGDLPKPWAYYTAEQMRQAQREAIAADRAQLPAEQQAHVAPPAAAPAGQQTQPLCDSALRAEPAGQQHADSEVNRGLNDPLYRQAVMIVRANNRASISLVQRHLAIGYNRAARLLEAMEACSVVSKEGPAGARSVLAAALDQSEAARSRAEGGNTSNEAATYMTNAQAENWAWEQVKEQVGTDGWTVSDSCTYYGFFLWGWRYRTQYERQRNVVALEIKGQSLAPSAAQEGKPSSIVLPTTLQRDDTEHDVDYYRADEVHAAIAAAQEGKQASAPGQGESK